MIYLWPETDKLESPGRPFRSDGEARRPDVRHGRLCEGGLDAVTGKEKKSIGPLQVCPPAGRKVSTKASSVSEIFG